MIKLYVIGFSFVLFVISSAQTNQTKAHKAYSNFGYPEVVDRLDALQSLSAEAKRELADSYMRAANFTKAELLYSAIYNTADEQPEDLLHYAQCLKSRGKYNNAISVLERYIQKNPQDRRAQLHLKNNRYFEDLVKDMGQFKLKTLKINSTHQDSGPAFCNDQLIFTSSAHDINFAYRTWNGNNLPFLDLYRAGVDSVLEINNAKPFGKINKKYHEGPASFNSDGNCMILTRVNYKKPDTNGIRNLELVEVYKRQLRWDSIVPFHINSSAYSVGHGVLSADSKTLVFTSDMPGGFGQTDLYMCVRKADKTWGEAINLGPEINTEGREMFPYINSQGIFFFSSDGHAGLGGLDIFAVPFEKRKQSKIKNLGTPVNSRGDDHGIILNASNTKGFISSNREGGSGDDDIYGLTVLKPLRFEKRLTVIVKDSKGMPLSHTIVQLKNNAGALTTYTTDATGQIVYIADEIPPLIISASKTDYLDLEKPYTFNSEDDEAQLHITLENNPGYSLLAVIKNVKDQTALENVKIKIQLQKPIMTDSALTANDGKYQKALPIMKPGDSLVLLIKLEKNGYLTKETALRIKLKNPGVINLNEYLNTDLGKIEVGLDIAKMIDIKPIYFDLGKFNIRKDAQIELDKIVKIMNDYPKMYIELGSHTDCRSSAASNLSLSDKRANASANYIKSNIQNPERITGKGYGESRLKNSCACEGAIKSKCSEAEHQENRRTEFIILKAE